MKAFDVGALLAAVDRTAHVYQEIIREETLSVGLAFWPAGARDDQTPHAEDEVYCVVHGRARLRVGQEERGSSPAPPSTSRPA